MGSAARTARGTSPGPPCTPRGCGRRWRSPAPCPSTLVLPGRRRQVPTSGPGDPLPCGGPATSPGVPMLNDVKRAPSADAARLGEPSYVWRSGQERRLQLIRRYVPLGGPWILDVGRGISANRCPFRDFTPRVYWLARSAECVVRAGLTNLVATAGQYLP